MRFFTIPVSGNMLDTASFFLNKSLVWRVLIIGIPLISLSLFVVLAFTCNEVENIITTAIARNEQMHAEALSLTFEQMLTDSRNQLQVLAAGSTDKDAMLARLNFRKQNEHFPYREIAFISSDTTVRYLLVHDRGDKRNRRKNCDQYAKFTIPGS